MLRTEPMAKIRMVFLQEDKKKVIDNLHEMGILDFRKSRLSLMDDSPLPYAQEIYFLLVRLEGALKLLTKQKQPKAVEELPLQELLEKAREMSEGIAQEINETVQENNELRQKLQELIYAEKISKDLASAKINFTKLESRHAKLEVYEGNEKEAIKLHEKLARERWASTKVISKGKEAVIVVVFDKEREQEIAKVIQNGKLKLQKINLSAKYLNEDMTSDLLAEKLENEISETKEKLEKTKKRIERISKAHYWEIAGIVELLHIELERANASLMFKKTEKTSILEGWIPEKKLEEFKRTMHEKLRGRLNIELVKDDELAPTLLGRKGALKAFDYAVEFFSIPRSDEIDPTWPFIFSFLIFYGFMVSDAGYGILSFILATFICKITNPEGMAYNGAKLWQIGAISAIVFGILTNQYFGLGLNQYFLPFRGIEWTKNIVTFLIAAVVIGLIEVSIGLSFGFVNKIKKGEKKKAYGKLFGIAMLVLGSLYIYGALFKGFGGSETLALGVGAAVSLALAIYLGGSEGAEVMSLISHTLSYSRLVGFGLTSVLIAYLIDMAFTPTLAHGILVFVALVLIFLVMHTLNMIVSIFEGIIQGLRLNVVEFFTKFYTGGGVKYAPFAVKRMLTKKKVSK